MVTRIWDTSVLDEAAEFTISLPIPESAYDVKNIDGSTPSVSLQVDGSSRKFALQVLSEINETEDMLNIILAYLLGDDWEDVAEATPQVAADKLGEIADEFMTFGFTATNDAEETATLALTAPSGIIAFRAFQAITSIKNLQGIAANWMLPLDEDDDEGYYYDDDDED